MLNPFITKKLFQGVVLELRAIITSYCQDFFVKLALCLLGKINEGDLRLVLGFEEEDPCIS